MAKKIHKKFSALHLSVLSFGIEKLRGRVMTPNITHLAAWAYSLHDPKLNLVNLSDFDISLVSLYTTRLAGSSFHRVTSV